MNDFFASIFSKQPDTVENEDVYVYRVPWYEQEHSLIRRASEAGLTEVEFLKRYETQVFQTFSETWKQRSLFGEFVEGMDCDFAYYLKGNHRDPAIEKIIDEILQNRIPFMDIASGTGMGLAPYILQKNPNVPCMITDINPFIIHSLYKCVKHELAEYNICFASFDNLDMPIFDNTFDYVTGVGAILFSSVGKIYCGNYDEFSDQCERRLLSEVYRVLKPGGRYIAVESEAEFLYDMEEVQSYFETHKNFLGLYSKEIVIRKLEELEEYKKSHPSIKTKMLETGFHIEVMKTYSRRLPEKALAQYFSSTGEMKELNKCDYQDIELIKNMSHQTIYVLQKPYPGGEG